MQSESSQPLISTDNPAFLESVEAKIQHGEPVVILLRFSHQGGNRDYFIVKSIDEFHTVLQTTHRRDAVSVFFSQSFPIQGIITPELKDRTISFLEEVIQNDEEAIFVIRLDTNEIVLGIGGMKIFSKPEEIEKWFKMNRGIPVLVGLLAFWQDDSEEMVTAYVRDSDGQIRRGAY
jgi:hypothetical protein